MFKIQSLCTSGWLYHAMLCYAHRPFAVCTKLSSMYWKYLTSTRVGQLPPTGGLGATPCSMTWSAVDHRHWAIVYRHLLPRTVPIILEKMQQLSSPSVSSGPSLLCSRPAQALGLKSEAPRLGSVQGFPHQLLMKALQRRAVQAPS